MSDNANKTPDAATPPQPPAPVAANLPRNVNSTNTDAISQKPGTTPAESSSGSPLKVAVPIVMLVAVVFGITFISQYSPKSTDDDVSSGPSSSNNSPKGEPPLRFNSAIRMWDPSPYGSIQDQIFPGFYEVNDRKNSAAFWFENRNPSQISMQLLKVSGGCMKCSSGRLAAIPPDITDQLVLTSVLSGIPQGLVTLLPVAMAGPAAHLAPERLNWQEHKFLDNPHATYTVPGAPGTGHLFSYQWGIFDLQFQVNNTSTRNEPLRAFFALQVNDTKVNGNAELVVQYEGVDPFDVSTKFINVGDWTENSEPRSFSFFVYSSTRGPNIFGANPNGDLVAPTVNVRMPGTYDDPGPFVSVSPAERVPESEMGQVSRQIRELNKNKEVRLESAYRYTVTVKPKVGEQRADIGLLERDIFLAIPDMKEPKQVRIKGIVRGPVWLDNNRTDIDLTSYRYGTGISHTIRLISDQRDALVELVKDECSPRFATYELKKLPPATDRGYYELTVTIPKESQTGSWNGTIVLELKGTRPQRIRIPIHGVAKF